MTTADEGRGQAPAKGSFQPNPKGQRLPNISDIASSKQAKFDEDLDLGLIILPDVVGYSMIVALPTVAEQTASGIIIPTETTERERAATIIGKVVTMGADCYRGVYPNGMLRFPSGPWCQVGDTVMFSRYQGFRFRVEGIEYRILSDDQVMATVPDGAEVSGL